MHNSKKENIIRDNLGLFALLTLCECRPKCDDGNVEMNHSPCPTPLPVSFFLRARLNGLGR